jgi:hypothetical protein
MQHIADISPARTLRTAQTVTVGLGPSAPGAARPGHRPPPDPGSGTNVKCLAPVGIGRYARPMEISPNWGNFPRFRVQVSDTSNPHERPFTGMLDRHPRSASGRGGCSISCFSLGGLPFLVLA